MDFEVDIIWVVPLHIIVANEGLIIGIPESPTRDVMSSWW